MSSYDIFVNSDWKNQNYFYELAPRIYHMTIIFKEKTLYFVSLI